MYAIYKKKFAGNIPTEHYDNAAICGVFETTEQAHAELEKVIASFRFEKKIHAGWYKPNNEAEPSTTRINVVDWRRIRTPKYYSFEIEELNETNVGQFIYETTNLKQ